MLLDGHLQVQAYELAHMPMREGILSPEDRAHLEHPLEVSHHAHLLVQLRGLGEAGLSVEIAEVEHVGATLRRATDEFGGVDFDEVVVDAEFAEEVAHA